MSLWLVFALMTGVAVFAVLWPLGRRAVRSGGSDIVVYRDQFSEIDRDRASGLIGAGEAEAAKVEVSRAGLIAAADAAEAEKSAGGADAKSTPEAASDWRRRAITTAIAGLVLLPVGSVALSDPWARPQMPGEPLAARLRAPRRKSGGRKLGHRGRGSRPAKSESRRHNSQYGRHAVQILHPAQRGIEYIQQRADWSAARAAAAQNPEAGCSADCRVKSTATPAQSSAMPLTSSAMRSTVPKFTKLGNSLC